MKSYPYFAIAEDFGYGNGGGGDIYTSHRIAFFTKRTGTWVEIVVDSKNNSNALGWNNVCIANNGSFFCILAADADTDWVTYTSFNEGQAWTKNTPSWPTTADWTTSYTFLVSFQQGFGISLNGQGWLVSADGLSWVLHEYLAWPPYSFYTDDAEWCYVDESGIVHIIMYDRNYRIWYASSSDLAIWTEPTLIIATIAHPREGACLIGKDRIILVASMNWNNDTIAIAISTDGGATWNEDSIALSSILGDGEFNSWSISHPLSLVGGIKDGSAHLFFSWYNTDLLAEEMWTLRGITAPNISTGSLIWAQNFNAGPIQAWWFVAGISDPVAENTWPIIGGYSWSEDKGNGWYDTYARTFAELNPETGALTTIYSLAGDLDYVTYWLTPEYTLSSRIPGGWFDAACYREFSRGGFAYFF